MRRGSRQTQRPASEPPGPTVAADDALTSCLGDNGTASLPWALSTATCSAQVRRPASRPSCPSFPTPSQPQRPTPRCRQICAGTTSSCSNFPGGSVHFRPFTLEKISPAPGNRIPSRPGLLRNRLRRLRSSTAAQSGVLVATVNFPFVATENRTLCWLAVAGLRSTLLSKPTARRQVADARMGDEDAAEALSGTGRLEGGVGEALRGESPDAPRVDRVEPVGPGPVVRGRTVFAAAARTAQAGPLRRDHRFPSRGVPRAVSEAAVRRGPRGWLRR